MSIANERILRASGITTRVEELTKSTNNAIQSFAELVNQLNKLQKVTKQPELLEAANEMNNAAVLVTQLFTARIAQIELQTETWKNNSNSTDTKSQEAV